MIQNGTDLQVADNSGAKSLSCIKVLGGSKRRYARIGDIVTASVTAARPRSEVSKKDVVRAVIVRTRAKQKRDDGSWISFDDNAAVIIDGQQEPVGTRIFGPIAKEVRDKGFHSIISSAKEVL